MTNGHPMQKNSGVSWLGDVPSHWTVSALKRLATIQTGLTLGKVYDGPVIERPYLRVANVQDGHLDLKDITTIEVPASFAIGVELQPGDVLMTEGGDLDKLGRGFLWNGEIEGCLHQNHIFALRCNRHKLMPKFLTYVTASPHGRDYFEATGKRTTNLASTNSTKVGAFPIALPPIQEQQRIAAYLDASCAAIDAAVAAKRRQLETLDALQRSVINRAVTRGLDPSVRTQRTDVEWIPEMPQHWRMVRVKDVLGFFNTVRVPLSAAERGVMTDKIYDYYGASGVIDKVESYLFDGTYILIAEDGANLLTRSKRLAFLATGKFWVNNHAHILKPRWGGDDTYFVNLLESQDFSLFVTGAAQPKLTMENLGRFKLAVPGVTEQKEIAAFIRQKDDEFRPLIKQIEQQIATLTAYRKSLIHECVTGQRRISEVDLEQVRNHE